MTETNEERLGTMKNSVLHARNFIGEDGILKFQNGEKVLNDFDWVIEQAERAQELKKEFADDIDFKRREVCGLQEENKRLREAFADLKRSLSAEFAGAINTGVKHSLINAIDRALGFDEG